MYVANEGGGGLLDDDNGRPLGDRVELGQETFFLRVSVDAEHDGLAGEQC